MEATGLDEDIHASIHSFMFTEHLLCAKCQCWEQRIQFGAQRPVAVLFGANSLVGEERC